VREETLIIRFEGVPLAEANRYARSLREELLNGDPNLSINQERESTDTQDFGSTLVLVLGAPAVVTAARALTNWLGRHNSTFLSIETKDLKFVARNVESANAAAVLEAALSDATRD